MSSGLRTVALRTAAPSVGAVKLLLMFSVITSEFRIF